MSQGEFDPVIAESDGITVSKTFAAEKFAHPAIELSIESHRDEPVRIQLTDPVPEVLSGDDIGFHPEFGGEFWSNHGYELTFERVFAPKESLITYYGSAELTPDADLELEAPTITTETIEGLDTIDDDLSKALGQERDDLVRNFLSGDEPNFGPAQAVSVSEGVSSGAEGPDSATHRADDLDVAALLAEQIRTGALSDADAEALHGAFGTGDAHAARLDHLAAQVSEVAAYTDALEGFLEEEGEPRKRLAAIESRVQELDQSIAGTEATIDELTTTVETVETTVEHQLEQSLADIDEAIADLEADIETLESFRSNILDAFGTGEQAE